jgi:hypothetical protein
MKSHVIESSHFKLPLIEGEYSMIPFDLLTLEGLKAEFKDIANNLLDGISRHSGTAFLTVHGKKLSAGQTLRRGGPHTDGSFDAKTRSWGEGGGGGWKIGENGPAVGSNSHARLYAAPTGGIILSSNFESCLGWVGEFDGIPGVGGDCRHIQLNTPFMLKRDTVYYGNNHFIHESVPVSEDVHRVFARITLPEHHDYTPSTRAVCV